jgi:hypothetical protein
MQSPVGGQGCVRVLLVPATRFLVGVGRATTSNASTTKEF